MEIKETTSQNEGNVSDIWNTSRVVAMDCEFVGVGMKKLSALGRCSIVDYDGQVQCDIYVKPNEKITDYRTRWSGLKPGSFIGAVPLNRAILKIKDILKDKILIGHDLKNDLGVLQLDHPMEDIRDTFLYKYIRDKVPQGVSKSLKSMHLLFIGGVIQNGYGHCSIQDSRAALALYKHFETQWEKDAALGITCHIVKNAKKFGKRARKKKKMMDHRSLPPNNIDWEKVKASVAMIASVNIPHTEMEISHSENTCTFFKQDTVRDKELYAYKIPVIITRRPDDDHLPRIEPQDSRSGIQNLALFSCSSSNQVPSFEFTQN